MSASRNVCYQFQETGQCKYGDTCRFSHDGGVTAGRGGASPGWVGFAQPRAPRWPTPGGFGGGAISQIPTCYQFRDTGTCRFGASCRFSHGDAGAGGYGGGYGGYSTGYASYSPRPVAPCFQFRETGQCRFGETCRFSHDLGVGGGGGGGSRYQPPFPGLTPGMCYKFATTGECKYGSSCKFSHGTSPDDKKLGGWAGAEVAELGGSPAMGAVGGGVPVGDGLLLPMSMAQMSVPGIGESHSGGSAGSLSGSVSAHSSGGAGSSGAIGSGSGSGGGALFASVAGLSSASMGVAMSAVAGAGAGHAGHAGHQGHPHEGAYDAEGEDDEHQ